MGYTHYFESKSGFSDARWNSFVEKVREIFDFCKSINISLAYEFDEFGNPPVCDSELVRFNGCGSDGHETFYLKKTDRGFNFCKTARKDYDLAVCMVILAMHETDLEAYSLGTDGDESDWEEAIVAYNNLFSSSLAFKDVFEE